LNECLEGDEDTGVISAVNVSLGGLDTMLEELLEWIAVRVHQQIIESLIYP